MKNQTPLTNAIDPVRNSRNRSPAACWTRAFPLILLALAFAWFALAPAALAVCQEGCDLSNDNTFLGDDALVLNTGGDRNTAIGSEALFSNTFGFLNTATGAFALLNNTTGNMNTAIGSEALFSNTTGGSNVANGSFALYNNTTGNNNTANGEGALLTNTIGSNNIALGFQAGVNSAGNFNIEIGNPGVAGESNTIRIGTRGSHAKTFIAGISGATVPDGIGVIVGANGKLGTVVSSERFKEAVKPMDKTSEAILALKPVTFRYKHELDPEGIPQFGLVAEEVEKVNPALVARDEQGKPYTVRYEAVNAMLLNEFLKEHHKNEKQEATIADLKAEIATLSAAVKEQASQIQKVSAQFAAASPSGGGMEMSKSVLQTIADNQ